VNVSHSLYARKLFPVPLYHVHSQTTHSTLTSKHSSVSERSSLAYLCAAAPHMHGCRFKKAFHFEYLVAYSDYAECLIRGLQTLITPRSSSCLRESGSVQIPAGCRLPLGERRGWHAAGHSADYVCTDDLFLSSSTRREGVSEGANILWSRIGSSVEGDMNNAQLRTKGLRWHREERSPWKLLLSVV